MQVGEVLSEMLATDKPKIAKSINSAGRPVYITIVTISPRERQFVMSYLGSTYNHLGNSEIMADNWEWA